MRERYRQTNITINIWLTVIRLMISQRVHFKAVYRNTQSFWEIALVVAVSLVNADSISHWQPNMRITVTASQDAKIIHNFVLSRKKDFTCIAVTELDYWFIYRCFSWITVWPLKQQKPIPHNCSEPKATSSNVLFCSTNSLKPKDVPFKMKWNREKTANPHIWEDGTRLCLALLL